MYFYESMICHTCNKVYNMGYQGEPCGLYEEVASQHENHNTEWDIHNAEESGISEDYINKGYKEMQLPPPKDNVDDEFYNECVKEFKFEDTEKDRLIKQGKILNLLFDKFNDCGWLMVGTSTNNIHFEGIESIEEWYDEETEG